MQGWPDRRLSLTHAYSTLNNQALANTAETFIPPAWSCGYDGKQDVNANKKGDDRFLFGDGQDNDHHPFDHDHSHQDHSDQDHSDHDHLDHDYSDHDHSHRFDPSNTEKALTDLQQSLRGSVLHVGKHRRVQGGTFSYWVDVYVEIDNGLCSDNGETCATGIGPKTINYGEL
jgi:hypothetical protein